MNALIEFLQSLVSSVATGGQPTADGEAYCRPGLHISTVRVGDDFTIVTLFSGHMASSFNRRDHDSMRWWRPIETGIEFVANLTAEPEAVAA